MNPCFHPSFLQPSENKWDLDELSNEFCRLHPDKVSLKATMNVDETKAAKTQPVANYIVECLQPFATASSAASSSDQTQLIADLQAQLETEKAKNKAPSPPAMSQPPAKRIRLCSKAAAVGGLPIQASSSSDPSQELVDKALDPTCQLTARIFQQYPTQRVAKTNISKWLKNIKAKLGPEKAQSIEKALDLAQQMQPCLGPMIIQQLRDKCAQIGLPVQWATKIKEPEIHQVLIAATCIAD